MTGPDTLFDSQIQAYLADVAAVLRTEGASSDDIASICDGLKTQIFEMAAQAGDPTEESVAQVIASMEDPKHFAAPVQRASEPIDKPRSRWMTSNDTSRVVASVGFYAAVSGPVLAILLGLTAMMLGLAGWEFGSFVLVTTAIIAIVFGLVSRKEPQGRAAILLAVGTLVGYFLLVLVGLMLE